MEQVEGGHALLILSREDSSMVSTKFWCTSARSLIPHAFFLIVTFNVVNLMANIMWLISLKDLVGFVEYCLLQF